MAQLEVADILQRVRRIQIVANRKVDDLLAGQYKSVFRGRGMEFDEVREYQPGDDVRLIDWNVTARAGSPFIKRFVEERELTVLFVVDVSASGAFGTAWRSKLETAVEVAAMLMFSALKNNDKVGLLTFCDEVIDFFPPRKGKSNVLHLLRELVAVEPVARPTSLAAPLEYLNHVQRRRAVVFFLSDLLAEFGRDVQRALGACNRRHDLVAVRVFDPREHELPDVGLITLRDAETGRLVEIDTHSAEVRRRFAARGESRRRAVSIELARRGVDELSVQTNEDYLSTVRRFFHMRERRLR